jgi:predicted transcriptional regulator
MIGKMRRAEFQDPFVRVLNHLENTLTASHIAAFPVVCWSPEDDVTEVIEKIAKDRLDFTHVPIRDSEGHVRWIVYREKINEKHGKLVDHAMPIEERYIVDAICPLRETLLLLRDSGVLLVRSPESGQPDGISGIINHADIQKTPVRLLLFAQITEIEARLRNRVSRESWEENPHCDKYKNSAKGKRRDPDGSLPLINYLNPSQLMFLARALDIPLHQKLSEDEFKILAKELNELRNAIAHSNDIGCDLAANPLDTIGAVNRAFDLAGGILAAVIHLGRTD